MRWPHPKLLAIGAALVGAAGGLAWPALPLPNLAKGGGDWSLPAGRDIARHVPQDMAVVTASMRWKGEDGGTALAEGHASWQLAGILQQQTATILTMPSQHAAEATQVAIGDSLPDGSKLRSIKGDQVTTQRGACLTTYEMFHTTPVEQSAGCK